jgi:phosphohistidine swiveling domain-containing protein
MSRYVLPLSSNEATLALAGGKGKNLAELTRAGFPVPPGFIVTTDAYQQFVEAGQLQSRIISLAKGISLDDPVALETTSAEIRALFEGGTVPAEIAVDVTSAYHTLLPKVPGSSTDASAPNATNAPSGLPVAVRSSATAEDLPGLAFAGQQDTYLNIVGESALIDAVKRCWASLWTARALAYRERNHIPPEEVALAVIVQEMVASKVSGVLFTANPVTGHRGEIVIDASFGLGEAVVSGLVDPDHYEVEARHLKITKRKLGTKEVAIVPRAGGGGGTEHVELRGRDGNGEGGRGPQEQALPDEQIIELARIAKQVEALFGAPQDIEWAWIDGQLYLLQSRPITSLYPLPKLPKLPRPPRPPRPPKLHESARPDEEQSPRVYVNFNLIQGITDPFTPLGIDALRLVFGGVRDLLRIQSPPRDFLPDAGGRLFLDFTDPVRDRRLRNLVLDFLARIDPGAQQTLRRLISEGRFAPKVVLTLRRAILLVWGVLPILRSVVGALLRPERVRPGALAAAEQFVSEVEKHAQAAKNLSACLRAMERDLPRTERISIAIMPTVLPAFAAVPIVDRWLTRWIGEKPGMALQLMRGLPGNITIEMNLKLWAATQEIRANDTAAQFMRTQSVETLVEAYRRGELPATAQRALKRFLKEYGMRGVAEIDLGRPRWRDDPRQIVETLLGYLRLEDPKLAPDVIYRRGAEEAERLASQYIARVRKTRFGWLRAKLLAGTIRRMRILGGLREVPLFYLVRVNDIYRTVLLDSAQQLVSDDELGSAEDLFFVPLDELKQFAQGKRIDLRATASVNRANYARERARRQVPRILLSTGEAFYEGMSGARNGGGEGGEGEAGVSGNELVGEAVSPGVVEGRAHVILDPAGARLEPGEILVCSSTDPGWTPLFLMAGGLVMEIGGVITHGSVVAREYGIPAVVGVHQATTVLKTGQQIRVDGNHGRVTILQQPK